MRDPVFSEFSISRHERQPVGQCLSDEQPVKRIAMMIRQMLDGSDVIEGDHQRREAVSHNGGFYRFGRSYSAKPGLDRNFPGVDQTDEAAIGGGNRSAALCCQARAILHRPNKDLRVEQEPHEASSPSKARWISGGRGASKSSDTNTFPFHAPKRTGTFLGDNGTRRARGLPALAMMISSPAAARSTRRERFPFASPSNPAAS